MDKNVTRGSFLTMDSPFPTMMLIKWYFLFNIQAIRIPFEYEE